MIGMQREEELAAAASALRSARSTGQTISDFPHGFQPANDDEICFIQNILADTYGEIGGWKIGASAPEATPHFAPLPAAWMTASGNLLSEERWRYRGLEAEVAFLVGEDLRPRKTPYSREEVIAVISSCHPAIEILESGFTDPTQVERNCMLSDLQAHGGFVYGPAYSGWQSVDFATERVTLTIDGTVLIERIGPNASGDLLGLLHWLANEGAVRTGGLRKGQWITTGSWTGSIKATRGSSVDVAFSALGSVSLRFA